MKRSEQLIRSVLVTNFVSMLILCTSCTIKGEGHRTAGSPALTSEHSEGGVGNTGGGNSDSKRRKIILEYFKNDALVLKTDLIQWLREIRQYRAQGVMSAQIHKMIDAGLIEDIQKSKLVPADSCIDGSGTVKSMSTRKVDNFKGTPVHPDVCINIPKLGAEGATYADIVGNLMHEYGRHFGLEDTDNFGVQPMSYYVTSLFSARFFTRNLISSVESSSTVVTQQSDLYVSQFGIVSYLVYVPPESKVLFQIVPMSGDCSMFRIEGQGDLIREDGQVIQNRESTPTSKRPITWVGPDAGPFTLPTTVSRDSEYGHIGAYFLNFEKAKTCRVNLKIQIAPDMNDTTFTSSIDIKDLGLIENQTRLWLSFYSLELRDLE